MREYCLRVPPRRAAAAMGLQARDSLPVRRIRDAAEQLAAAALREPRVLLGLPERGRAFLGLLRPGTLRALRDLTRGDPDLAELAGLIQAEQVARLERMAARSRAGHPVVDLRDTGAPTRRSARRWRTADGGEPHIAASPVPPGPAPRPVGVGRVQTVAIIPGR
jgi:hypothetical protein